MFSKNRYTIEENVPIAAGIYRMVVSGDTSSIRRPGQFVNIEVPGYYLRRPISVSNYSEESITLVYKVFGTGTEALSKRRPGEQLDMLVGLGNGFDLAVQTQRPLIVGGGVGVPPLYRLAIELVEKGAKPVVVLGFNREEDSFYEKEFTSIPGVTLRIATIDGSLGTKGTVVDAIHALPTEVAMDYLFACGPMPMLKALDTIDLPGQFSFEERMGCGFGGCMGCTHKTTNGNKRICLEGPVLRKEEIIW